MTVASTTRKTALFAGDNATTDFPFTFKVFAAADLLVVRRTIATGVETELALTTHYNVTLNADQEANPGGIVALLAPLLDTYNLIISSKINILQPAALANQGGFYPKVIMDALDRLTIISQQLKEDVDRSVKFNISSAYSQFNLPDPAAGQFLRWSTDLTTLENGFFSDATLILHSAMMADAVTKSTIAEVLTAMGLDVNIETLALPANTTISAFIKTLLDDADVGTAQSTLGISAFIKTLLDDANAATARATLGVDPPGSILFWPTETPPTGYLECDGASLDRTTYAALFAVIGTMYGTADGTHFNLPDYRGRFLRSWAHGSTNDPDRAARTAPTATGATIVAGDHVGTEQDHQIEAHHHTEIAFSTAYAGYAGSGSGNTYTANTGDTGGYETRPINTNVMFCIKY